MPASLGALLIRPAIAWAEFQMTHPDIRRNLRIVLFIFIFFFYTHQPVDLTASRCAVTHRLFSERLRRGLHKFTSHLIKGQRIWKKNSYAKPLRRSTNINALADSESLKTVGWNRWMNKEPGRKKNEWLPQPAKPASKVNQGVLEIAKERCVATRHKTSNFKNIPQLIDLKNGWQRIKKRKWSLLMQK